MGKLKGPNMKLKCILFARYKLLRLSFLKQSYWQNHVCSPVGQYTKTSIGVQNVLRGKKIFFLHIYDGELPQRWPLSPPDSGWPNSTGPGAATGVDSPVKTEQKL